LCAVYIWSNDEVLASMIMMIMIDGVPDSVEDQLAFSQFFLGDG
jgi:hypothetical protein